MSTSLLISGEYTTCTNIVVIVSDNNISSDLRYQHLGEVSINVF